MKTWEETIEYIRREPDFAFLVEKAYLDADLPLNVERYKRDEEYIETISIINKYRPNAQNILDIGCGNGVSCISFALDGYSVTAVEPNPSETIGAGAIGALKENFNLDNLNICQECAETLELSEESFDIIYIRQAMHHAADLNQFVANCMRFLKKGGLFLTVRDHVVFDDADKAWFLECHPLHKYYGGENAFTKDEYLTAIQKGGAEIKEVLAYYDSVINYFPMTEAEFQERFSDTEPDETRVPGRSYSFVAVKK